MRKKDSMLLTVRPSNHTNVEPRTHLVRRILRCRQAWHTTSWRTALWIAGLWAAVVGIVGPGIVDAADSVELPVTLIVGSPCSTERAALTGSVKINFHQTNDFHFNYQLKAEGTGTLGNVYQTSFNGSEKFAAPSGISGPAQFFDVPFHGEVISKGSAPNFAIRGTVRIYVQNGAPIAQQVVENTSLTCHG